MNTPSIQEIRSNLSYYITRAQQGETITISKRGYQVAVLISLDEYQRLTTPQKNIFEAIVQFRHDYPCSDEEIPIDSIFEDIRSKETGREVNFD